MKKSTLFRSGMALVLFAAAYAIPLTAATTSKAVSNVRTATSTKARRLQAPSPLAPTGFLGAGGLSGRCTLHAMNRGSERKGVKVTIEARLIDVITGASVEAYADVKGRTRKNGEFSVDYPVTQLALGVRTVALSTLIQIGGGKRVTDLKFTCTLSD